MEAKELRLRIVHLKDVLLHEEIEQNRVERLMERLSADRVLKNPPIVTETRTPDGWSRYVVLDGASRSSALRNMCVRDVLAQIIDYHSPNLRLESWHHLLLDIDPAQLRRDIEQLDGISLLEMDEAEASKALERRDIIAYLLFDNRSVAGIRCTDSQYSQPGHLNAIVQTYESKAKLYRVATTDLEQLTVEHHRLGAVVIFPKYHPNEIIRLAMNGAKVPMGITRHIIPERALRVNLPLDILESNETLEEKNAWLDSWLKAKVQDHSVRFYQEPVFLFDE